MGKTSDRHCEICNIGFSTELSLKEHRLSLMHHKILNHQLRSQGIVDPEHFCFLCQKSLFFNAWADHLLDRVHRQRVFAMKAEETQQQAALHMLAARSAWNPLMGANGSLSRSGSTASLGESRYTSAAESFMSSEGHHSDVDWRGPERRFDRETERLIQRTQALLQKRQASKGRQLLEEAEEEDMTPVTSLQSTERSDWLPGQQQEQLCFDATASQSSSCSGKARVRRRAARKLTRSTHNDGSRTTPVIEPIVRLEETAAAAATTGAFEALLAADRSAQPFQFGRHDGPADFSFRLPSAGLTGPAGGVVARMQEAVRLSKAEEATRGKAAQCEERLDELNARVEQLLSMIAVEEDRRERFRIEEAALHSQRMEIIRSICAPRGFSWGSQEEEEEEEEPSLPLGFDSGRSESPLEPLESAAQELQIGDQTCRDILSKVMERRLIIEEEEEEEEEEETTSPQELSVPASLEGSEDTLRQKSGDRGRARTPARGQSVRSGSLRRQRDPCLTAMMKEYLHAEPSSSDVDLDQTPRSVEGDEHRKNSREDASSSGELPSTAAEIFPGTISAHDGQAVLDLCVYKGYVYSAGEDCVVRKFSLQSHECLCEYRGHAKLVHCLALSDEVKGEDRLFSGGFDCTLLVFNVKTGRELQRCPVDAAVHALAVAWSILHVGLANGCLLSFCLVRRRFQDSPWCLSQRPITCLTALPERQCLLAGAESDGIRVVSREGDILRHILPAERDLLPLAALLCHGRVLTFHDCQLLCFDLDSGQKVAHLELPTRISSLATTASHLLLGTVTGRVHSVRSCRLLQEANICLQIEDEAASVQLGGANEAILTMTCSREALLVGDEKGRIIIRKL